jgi:hypothetical protein
MPVDEVVETVFPDRLSCTRLQLYTTMPAADKTI